NKQKATATLGQKLFLSAQEPTCQILIFTINTYIVRETKRREIGNGVLNILELLILRMTHNMHGMPICHFLFPAMGNLFVEVTSEIFLFSIDFMLAELMVTMHAQKHAR
ncbi:hypothetical protein ACJX0J_022781, partial [Zea mays]